MLRSLNAGIVVERLETNLPGLKGSPLSGNTVSLPYSHTHISQYSLHREMFPLSRGMVLFQEQLSVVKEALKHQITPLSLRTLHFTYHCSAYVNSVILSFDKVYTGFGVRFSRPSERYFIGSRSHFIGSRSLSKIPRYMALLPEAVSRGCPDLKCIPAA